MFSSDRRLELQALGLPCDPACFLPLEEAEIALLELGEPLVDLLRGVTLAAIVDRVSVAVLLFPR